MAIEMIVGYDRRMQTASLSRDLTRRNFLGAAAGLALASVNGPGGTRTGTHSPARALAPVAGRANQDLFVVNMLGGIRNPNRGMRGGPSGALRTGVRPVPDERAMADVLASGTAAVNITVGYVAGSQEPFESSVADVARWNRVIRARPESLLKVHRARGARVRGGACRDRHRRGDDGGRRHGGGL